MTKLEFWKYNFIERRIFVNYDYLIVGAGLFGSVLAERIANNLNLKVLVIEKRSHIGGNCYSKLDEETKIL